MTKGAFCRGKDAGSFQGTGGIAQFLNYAVWEERVFCGMVTSELFYSFRKNK